LAIQKNIYSELSKANLNAYKRILNGEPFMKRDYGGVHIVEVTLRRDWTAFIG